MSRQHKRALGVASGSVGRSKEAFSPYDRNSNLSDDDDVEATSCNMGLGNIALSRVWRDRVAREMIHSQAWYSPRLLGTTSRRAVGYGP